jgi:vacuolar iron transporter family protein
LSKTDDRIRRSIRAGHPFGSKYRERWHREGRSGTLRAAVFGMSDGLVSNLALILGVAGSGVSSRVILLAGVAGLLAGAFSMGAGEYVSMRVQRDMLEYALRVESLEIELVPEAELKELTDIYEKKGLSPELAGQVAAELMAKPASALDAHAREELGLDPGQLGSPWGAAISSFATFAVGAIIPLTPYVLSEGDGAFVGAIVAAGLALALVGGFMARMAGRHVALGAGRMLTVGGLAAAATYAIGSLFDVAVS